MAARKTEAAAPAKSGTGSSLAKKAASNKKVSQDKVSKTTKVSTNKKRKPAKAAPEKLSQARRNSKGNYRFTWMKKLPNFNRKTIKIEVAETDADDAEFSEHDPQSVEDKCWPCARERRFCDGQVPKCGACLRQRRPCRPQTADEMAVFSNAARLSKAKALDISADTKVEELSDFNEPAAAGPSTPRKFLFGTKPANNKGKAETDQYEDEYDSDYEELPHIDIKHLPIPAGKEDEFKDADHKDVPKSLNNMAKAALRQRADIPDPNGRKHGRKLVQWHRPRMMEKLLLFLDYECHMQQVPIPWDDIVRRLQPGSSGPCATQMLMKMRERLVVEGHMVPPEKTKPHIKPNPKVRGFVRKDPDGDPGVVRVVAWNEPLEHPKKSLENPGITVGSGKYTRGPDGRKSQSGARRNEPRLKLKLPDEVLQDSLRLKEEASAQLTKARRDRYKRKHQPARRQNAREDAEERGDIADPAELSSDGEWDPSVTKKPRRLPAKSGTKPVRMSSRKSRVKIEPEAEDEDVQTEKPGSSMMEFGSEDEEESPTLPIKFSIAPEKLAQFPVDKSRVPTPDSEEDHDDHDDQASVDDNLDAATQEFEQDDEAESNDGHDFEADEYEEEYEDGYQDQVVEADDYEESEAQYQRQVARNQYGEARYQDEVVGDDEFDPNGFLSYLPFHSGRRSFSIMPSQLHSTDDPFVENSMTSAMQMSQGYDMSYRSAYEALAPAASFSQSSASNFAAASSYNTSQNTQNLMNLDGYEADPPFLYDDQGANTPPRAGYDQAEGDFINVSGRVFEDTDPQPGDDDYDGNWRAPTLNMHFDEQDENVPPHGIPSPGYHDYDSDSGENVPPHGVPSPGYHGHDSDPDEIGGFQQ